MTGRPLHSVPIQEKTWHAARDRDDEARRGEERQRDLGKASCEHVVHPDAETDECRRHGGERHVRVEEDRPARRDRHDRRHDAHRRQEDDVHVGMAEEPEQVLPQQRIAARNRLEEMEAEVALEREHHVGGGQRRQRKYQGRRRGEDRPAVERQAVERHAGRAHAQDRDDEVDRAHRRRDGEEEQAEVVEVDLVPGRVGLLRQWHVVEPAVVGRRADDEARVDENAGREVDPVAERVHARKGHVASADHERDEVVAERAAQERRHEQEDHRQPVHREEAVVGRGPDQPLVRLRELRPHQ